MAFEEVTKEEGVEREMREALPKARPPPPAYRENPAVGEAPPPPPASTYTPEGPTAVRTVPPYKESVSLEAGFTSTGAVRSNREMACTDTEPVEETSRVEVPRREVPPEMPPERRRLAAAVTETPAPGEVSLADASPARVSSAPVPEVTETGPVGEVSSVADTP